MTKKEHISYWIHSAKSDWKASMQLFKGRSYIQALFFAHLVLEKTLKAHWVKDNSENHPPKTHNLLILLNDTKLQLANEDLKFLDSMNEFQLEGRYPDYTKSLHKKCNNKFTNDILKHAEEIRKCLAEQL